MHDIFTSDAGDAITITKVGRADLPRWLDERPEQREWIAVVGYKSEPGSSAFVPAAAGRRAHVIAAPAEGETVWSYASLPKALPEGRYRFEDDIEAANDIALGWALGAYEFDAYRTPARESAKLVWPPSAERGEVLRLAAAMKMARDLINTPAEDMGPQQLADRAVELAAEHGAEGEVIVGEDLLARDFPAIHAVGRASSRAPRLIDMRWGDAAAPKVTLVGKGVCFDTGGLDIKPHDGMLEMKKDMGGAAVVLGLASALMALAAPIRLRVLVPAIDNAISGNALRPRDILRTRAGKTVEIGNTDAEGRLILCDALAEADREGPELLIDCATLTGAAKIALGTEVQALFCDDDRAAGELVAAGSDCGDPLWCLPIWRPYRKQIDSPCADLNNVGKGPFGGAIIAALYLAQFVSAAKTWAHLDVFAANQTARPGRPEGGEATGLRALEAFIRRRYD